MAKGSRDKRWFATKAEAVRTLVVVGTAAATLYLVARAAGWV